MARNAVQFQRRRSEAAFERQYGTEEQCRAVVVASRWPDGFACPVSLFVIHATHQNPLSAARIFVLDHATHPSPDRVAQSAVAVSSE